VTPSPTVVEQIRHRREAVAALTQVLNDARKRIGIQRRPVLGMGTDMHEHDGAGPQPVHGSRCRTMSVVMPSSVPFHPSVSTVQRIGM